MVFPYFSNCSYLITCEDQDILLGSLIVSIKEAENIGVAENIGAPPAYP